MVLFKAIVIGLLAWELVLLLRRRRERPNTEPTYVFIPPDSSGPHKEATILNQRGPPPSYDNSLPIKH